jgi:hypothetical protein
MARKHNVAIKVVHHLGKSQDRQRMGQRMLGSVANHAWGEDSLYLMRSGKDKVKMEFESKVAPAATYQVSNLENTRWEPSITPWKGSDDTAASNSKPRTSTRGRTPDSGLSAAGRALEQLGGGIHSASSIAKAANITYQQAYRQLSRDEAVEKHENGWAIK